MGDTCLRERSIFMRTGTLVHEYPLSPELLSMSRVWKSPDGRDYIIAAKGSPRRLSISVI